MRVAVVGAGVVGCAVGASLSEAGAEVHLVDPRPPGSGTSSTTFAWVNANNKAPRHYRELNRAGMVEHHQRSRLGHTSFHPVGHLEVATDPEHAAQLQARVERLLAWGYQAALLTEAQARALVPELATAEAALRAWFPAEGYCDVPRYISECLSLVRQRRGVLYRDAVESFEPGPTVALVLRKRGRLDGFDKVVVAAGRWTANLLADAGVHIPLHPDEGPGSAQFGFLTRASVAASSGRPVVTTSLVSFRPDAHGLLLQCLDLDRRAHPDLSEAERAAVANQMGDRLKRVLALPHPPRTQPAEVGTRVLPADGQTVSGYVDAAEQCYVLATHSGVTLAPLLGRLVAEELRGAQAAQLAGFRPARFAGSAPVREFAPPRRPGEQ